MMQRINEENTCLRRRLLRERLYTVVARRASGLLKPTYRSRYRSGVRAKRLRVLERHYYDRIQTVVIKYGYDVQRGTNSEYTLASSCIRLLHLSPKVHIYSR